MIAQPTAVELPWNPWLALRPSADFPAVNLWGNDHEAIIRAEIPGVDPKSLDLAVADNVLTVKGTREPFEVDGVSLWRDAEAAAFERQIELPFRVEAGQIQASAKNGVLTLRLPRLEAERPRKIAVQIG